MFEQQAEKIKSKKIKSKSLLFSSYPTSNKGTFYLSRPGIVFSRTRCMLSPALSLKHQATNVVSGVDTSVHLQHFYVDIKGSPLIYETVRRLPEK